MTRKEKRPDRLYALAENQGGYFTSADASALGYTTAHQYFHVKRGNWVRVDRGIYRLKRFPSTAHEDLIRWWLWSRKKGAISHESAAALYDLGDVLPSKTHLTVPQDFRKKPAAGVVLHKAQLDEKDMETREGCRVTTPLRDRKSTRLNSSHLVISYAVFCLKKKTIEGIASDLSLSVLNAVNPISSEKDFAHRR